MNLVKIVCMLQRGFIRSTLIPTSQPSSCTRKLQTTVDCHYAERQYTKKVFKPSFGNDEVASVEEETVVKKHKTESDLYLESKEREKRVRTLNSMDKAVLVMLGKYKRIQDVPNQITYSSLKRKKEVEQEMKQLFLGSVFKYVYAFEYASFFITGAILAFSLYWYNKVKKSSVSDTSNELNEQ